MRATIRAWACAAGVHSPSRSGTMPSATHRRSVAGETESARATPVSESAMRRADSHLQVRLLALEVAAVLLVDRLGDGDQGEGGLHVPARLDPPARDRHRDVLLALEVAVGDLGGHRHLDLGLPVDVVAPLPVEVAVLVGPRRADVHHLVEVRELEPLRRVGVAELGPHVRVGVHHREDLVDGLAQLLRRLERGAHAQEFPVAAAGLEGEGSVAATGLGADGLAVAAAAVRAAVGFLAAAEGRFGARFFLATGAAVAGGLVAARFLVAVGVILIAGAAFCAGAGLRLAAGAGAAGAAGFLPPSPGRTSSDATRAARDSTSPRSRLTSSRTRMSSSVWRRRPAAAAISSTISRVRSRVTEAPSADAESVRSTADRIAATASVSTDLLSCLSFFLESFFAMARGTLASGAPGNVHRPSCAPRGAAPHPRRTPVPPVRMTFAGAPQHPRCITRQAGERHRVLH